jgi:hypothetical protein
MKAAAAKSLRAAAASLPMQSLDIHGFTYEERYGLLPLLTDAFSNCGGWLLERKTLSPTNMEFRLEIQLQAIQELYGAVVGTGVELTRAGHMALTELCTRRRHLGIAELRQVVAIRLELNFLDDVTLHSLLASGSGLA